MIDDLFAPERAMVERLNDQIKTVPTRRAKELRDLGGDGKPQSTPAIFVLLGRTQTTARDTTTQMTLQLVAVIVTRDVSGAAGGSGARDAAGPLAMQVIGALHGWRPCDGFDHLRLSGSDAPLLFDGYFMLPLVFTTNTFITGE